MLSVENRDCGRASYAIGVRNGLLESLPLEDFDLLRNFLGPVELKKSMVLLPGPEPFRVAPFCQLNMICSVYFRMLDVRCSAVS
jgi:hypothetical protein